MLYILFKLMTIYSKYECEFRCKIYIKTYFVSFNLSSFSNDLIFSTNKTYAFDIISSCTSKL